MQQLQAQGPHNEPPLPQRWILLVDYVKTHTWKYEVVPGSTLTRPDYYLGYTTEIGECVAKATDRRIDRYRRSPRVQRLLVFRRGVEGLHGRDRRPREHTPSPHVHRRIGAKEHSLLPKKVDRLRFVREFTCISRALDGVSTRGGLQKNELAVCLATF